MSIDALREALPAYAKDLSLNLSTLANESTLNEQQKWGTFLASAYAVGEPLVVRHIEQAAKDFMPPEAREAAKAAAAIMAMNNVYYRSLHMLNNAEYRAMPARLRMNILGSPGAPKNDFELWSVAVSAINGCGACLDSHEAELRKHGATLGEIQTALRIAAVVNAVSRVLAAEHAREPAPEVAAAWS